MMRLDELKEKLDGFDFVKKYYTTNKTYEELEDQTHRILKIYGEESKMAEIVLDQAYMMKNVYYGFEQLTMLEQQALLKVLIEFVATPVEQRQSDLFYAYFNDLNGTTNYIKRNNDKLVSVTIPSILFKTMDDNDKANFLFTVTDFNNFPEDYKPRYDEESFVKVISEDEMASRFDKNK